MINLSPNIVSDASRSAEQIELSLFVPFYSPPDEERRQEIHRCLRKNLICNQFKKIYLLKDDESELPFTDSRIIVIQLSRRPSYLDWIKQSQIYCPNQVSILANSDIWFDSSIGLVRDIFSKEQRSFVALSRYDNIDGDIKLHEKPSWSQDTWVFNCVSNISPSMEKQLDIPMGVPRCDNKVAYIFSINGFSIYNPCREVISVHEHRSNLRYYDKKNSSEIIGSVAMVHPSTSLLSPSALDIEVWSHKSMQYKDVKINRSLEVWETERNNDAERRQGVFGYNLEWQYPAITEKHAFLKVKELLQPENSQSSVAYFGFPWATLIDLKRHEVNDKERIERLMTELSAVKGRVGKKDRVATVCQHIHLMDYLDVFLKAGVTDIFWVHATTKASENARRFGVKIHPFPLYPVHQVHAINSGLSEARKYLFSFVGARSNDWYLTKSRNIIIDELSNDARGKVIKRDAWHYEKIVYQNQVRKNSNVDKELIDKNASKEFREILSQSIFTLCPSGSGPNSIRVWEAAYNGSIPVILSDTFKHPGDPDLWTLATVQCLEARDDICALPDKLEAIAANPEMLQRKRAALQELVKIYGPDKFVTDILEFINSNPRRLPEALSLQIENMKDTNDSSLANENWLGFVQKKWGLFYQRVSHIVINVLFNWLRLDRLSQKRKAKALFRNELQLILEELQSLTSAQKQTKNRMEAYGESLDELKISVPKLVKQGCAEIMHSELKLTNSKDSSQNNSPPTAE